MQRRPVRRRCGDVRAAARDVGGEALRIRRHPDAWKVEPVGVPAGSDGRIAGHEPVRVLRAGVLEDLALRG